MLKELLMRFIGFILVLLFFSLSCDSTEPPPIVPPPPPPPIVRDTITLSQEYITGRSITINVKTTNHNTKSNIKLLRKIDVFKELLAEYPILVKDTSIIDDNDGAGLLLDTVYTYFAVRVDSTGEEKDTSNIINVRKLPPTSYNYTWTEYIMGEFQSELFDVWGTDENNVWAVGSILSEGQYYGALHWDGSNWLSVDSVGGYTINGFSADDIWVAGGAVYHYNGVKWERKDGYSLNGQGFPLDTVLWESSEFTSIWGTSSNNLYFGNLEGKIIHWDGEKASIENVQASQAFRDIWGISENEIYAVAGSIQLYRPGELYLYDGSSWTLIKKASLSPPPDELLGPFNSVWSFVGRELYTGGGKLGVRINNKWEEYNLGYEIQRVRGINDIDFFTTGPNGEISHYNGSGWNTYTEINNDANLVGIYAVNNSVFIVGWDGIRAYIYIGRR